MTQPRSSTRRRPLWIALAALMVLVTVLGLLTANRQPLKVAAMRWWIGPPPTAQVLDLSEKPSGVTIPVRAGDRLLTGAAGQLYFSPWNWAFADGQAISNTPGAYFKVRFSGRRLVAHFDLTWLRVAAFPQSSYPVVAVSVDNGPPQRLALSHDRGTLDLLEGQTLNRDPAHPHTAVVMFIAAHHDRGDRWTTPTAAMRLTGLDLDANATVHAAPVRPHRLLVYGDSHSEGIELIDAGSHTVNQDARRAFPHLLAQAWDAEVGVVAFGGVGYVTGMPGPQLPPTRDAWAHCWQNVSRLSPDGRLLPAPDAILSALGDNDPDHADVSQAVTELARSWRSAAPDAQLLFALPPNNGADGFRARLLAGLAPISDPRLRVLDPGQNFLTQPALSFGNHLNANGQQAYAQALLNACAQPFAQSPPAAAATTTTTPEAPAE